MYLLAAIVCFVAVTIRLLPLAYSGLPYNVDGFSLTNIAERTQTSGHLITVPDDPNIPNYNVPMFAVLLTSVSEIVGVEPLALAQPLIPILTIPAILVMFALVRRVTKNDYAATFASLYLGIEGLYVFSTATVIKASIAFALIPIILFLYWERNDSRKRSLCAFLLVILPLVHHLSSLIAFTAVTLVLSNDLFSWWKQGRLNLRRFLLEAALGPLLIIPGLIYYDIVNLKYFQEVYDARQIVLFLSVLFMAIVIHRGLSLPSKRMLRRVPGAKKRWSLVFDEKLAYPIGAVILLLINYRTNIFVGTIQTKPALLTQLIFYFILIMICVVGFNLIRHFHNNFRPVAMAFILAPFSMMVFAFLRGLDPLSFLLMYRSFPYMAFGVAMCAGVGMAFITSLRRNRAFKTTIVAGFVALLLLSLPLGYNSEQMYDVENATAQYEFEAMTRIHLAGAEYLGTDQRIWTVMNSYFFQTGDGWFPDTLDKGQSLSRYDFLLILDLWTTQGAQRYPLPNLVLEPEELARLQEDNNVIYSIVSPIGGATIVSLR
jgi:hypothetical protein